jgi:hypothetical protein
MKDTYSEEWRAECEAKEWIKQYKAQERQFGKIHAREWWLKTSFEIQKRRGKLALEKLTSDMKKYYEKGGKS